MPRRTTFSVALMATAILILPIPAAAQFEDQSVAAFRAADADGDELLTFSEFRLFIQQMANAGAPMSRRIRNFGAYRLAFNRVDADGNGVATPTELRAAEQAER